MDDQELISVEQQGIIDYLKSNLPKYDLVIVSDFGHGMLTNDIIEVLCREARCLAVNVQTNSANLGFNFVTKYRRADLVCIDEREIRLAMHDKQSDLESLVKKIHRQLSCQQVMVTRGPDGAISFRKEGFDSAPALAQTSVDKVGAGDAFFSYVAPCFAIGLPQDLTNFVGNAVGAIAVQIVGNRESVQYVDLMKYITRLLKL